MVEIVFLSRIYFPVLNKTFNLVNLFICKLVLILFKYFECLLYCLHARAAPYVSGRPARWCPTQYIVHAGGGGGGHFRLWGTKKNKKNKKTKKQKTRKSEYDAYVNACM